MNETISHLNMCLFACIIVHYLLHFIHDHNHESLEADIENFCKINNK